MIIENTTFHELNLEEYEKQEQEEASSLQEQEEDKNLKRVEDIREVTGYEFRDPILLQQSFTHHSYEEGCSSLERLEFVGDAFLNYMFAKEHYSLYPDLDSGKLTRLRAVNVDTEKLARAALKHDLHKFLSHNIFLLAPQVKEFRDAIKEHPLHSSGLIDAPKVLADIVESLVGAVHIDSNYSIDTTWKVAKKLLEPIITPETIPMHPVTQLYELCNKKKLTVKMIDTWKESGETEFVVDEQYFGKAEYKAKRVIAKNRAALEAYNQVIGKLDLGECSHDIG